MRFSDVRFALAGFCGLGACALVGQAGTIRHDVADSEYLALAAEPEYAAVGRINAAGLLASGTLISDEWVLTAAHVVDSISGSLQFALNSQTYNATQWIIHPDWTGDIGGGGDLALVHLTKSVVGVSPATLYDGVDEVGLIGTSVGYGATGTGLTGATGSSGTKRAGENLIGGLGSVFGYPDTVLLADFDAPGSTSTDPKAISLPLEYLPAPGDSGGGLFIDVDGETFLAGVTSFLVAVSDGAADASYGDAAGWTRVSDYYDWIDSIVPLEMIPVLGDLNSDGVVDIFDVAIISEHWGTSDETADANGDGTVDIFDVAFVSTHWTGSSSAVRATSVPEPEPLRLAASALVGAAIAARRRRGSGAVA